MRVLLSALGSRGEIQPVLAFALRLRELGHDVRACVPPDFRAAFDARGLPAVPVGPSMRHGPDLSTEEGRGRAAADTVTAQFATLPDAARDRDVLVACGVLQIAARSVTESLGIGYVHAHYCPATLPSGHLDPAPWPGWPPEPGDGPGERWAAEARRWDGTWADALNAGRAGLGLDPVHRVRDHVLTDRPWLAADPALAPWPGDAHVAQTGAWLLPDERPLPGDLESFLDAGEPPVYFGLGSMPSPAADTATTMLAAARAHGRRAIVSRGWAGLLPPDAGADCTTVGEANHRALFRRVAAVVHHGGAGTTTTAAAAGAPQVVLPQVYDQPYWAGRVTRLGIGAGHRGRVPDTASLSAALDVALTPGVAERARAVAATVCTDGTSIAAELLERL